LLLHNDNVKIADFGLAR